MKDTLHGLIEKFDLIERTYNYSKIAIENYIKEEPEKALKNGLISSESIKYVLWACSYTISNFGTEDEEEFIDIEIDYFNSKGNACLGYYSMLYNCNDGQIFDDTTVINL